MKKYLKKRGAFLTDTTISDDVDIECIKSYNADLLDETKYKRFTLGGNNQGVFGAFGYAIITEDDVNTIKYFVVELYSFQTLPSKEIFFQYENVYIAHELTEDGEATDIYYVLPGGNEKPKMLISIFNDYMDITSDIKVIFCGQKFSDVLEPAKQALENINKKEY